MTTSAWLAGFLATLLAATAIVSAQRAPAAGQSGLGADVLALACAPTSTFDEPAAPLRITGGQDSFTRRNYAPGDLVTINAGTMNGVNVGDEYFARRVLKSRSHRAGDDAVTVHTAGWLRIWAVDDRMSLATVTHACDAIEVGDYLEPFTLPKPAVASRDKLQPERDHYARVMPGADLRQLFGKGDFFTIDRGANEGLQAGAQFVVYRDKGENQNFLFELGEAVAVSVGPQMSTLRVTLARDAFTEGDYVAERK